MVLVWPGERYGLNVAREDIWSKCGQVNNMVLMWLGEGYGPNVTRGETWS